MTLTDKINAMFSKKASSPAQRAVNAGAPNATENPTDAQKAVGNYRKVHLNIDGFRISIENPKGSVRSGTSPDGTKWSNVLACDYGDIRGTESVDGDPVDIYLSDHPEKGAVFVIDQIDPKTGKFDEHKVMYGFDSIEDAKKTYLACYQKGWKGLGWITPVSKAEFRKWIDSSYRKTKPFHEYKSVNPIIAPIKFNKKAASINIGDFVKQPIEEYEKEAQVKQDNRDKMLSDDMKYFSGVIAPWIKDKSVISHGGSAEGGPISFRYYSPDFYKDIKLKTLDNVRNAALSGGSTTSRIRPNGQYDTTITMDPGVVEKRPDILAHEIRHAQNLSTVHDKYNRNKYEDDTLHAAYAFNPDAIRINYGGSSPIQGIDIDRLSSEEEAATNAQYQWAAFQGIKKQLGRRPSPKEFVDGISGMSIDELRKLRAYYGKNGGNSYEPVNWAFDAANKWAVNNGYKSINDYQDSVRAKTKKLLESGIDSDKAMKQIMDDPASKSLNEATKNVSAPVWTDEQIEAFRNALMHVARNNTNQMRTNMGYTQYGEGMGTKIASAAIAVSKHVSEECSEKMAHAKSDTLDATEIQRRIRNIMRRRRPELVNATDTELDSAAEEEYEKLRKEAQYNPDDPMEGVPDGVKLRSFIDAPATRTAIMDNVLEAVKNRFPVEDDDVRLELRDVKYEGPTSYTLEQQKQALLNNRRLGCSIAGTWRLTDKRTGQVLDERRDGIIRVPYYTDRGTIINNGNEYTVISQARLSPGVYVRRKQNGELESQFNVANGLGFRIGLDRETGALNMSIGQGHVPLYPVLHALGVSDDDMRKSWGNEVANVNIGKFDPRALDKVYARYAGRKANMNLTTQEKAAFITEALSGSKLDPSVVVRTLGLENVEGVTGNVMLRAAQKLLNINRGAEDPDERDNPRFSKFYGVEDMMRERIDKDAGRLTKSMLFRAKRDKSLARIGRNALAPYLDTFLSGSGLAMPGEEANPLSILTQQSRITRLGEGGISSPDLVTPEARNVQGDYLGYVDFISGPESFGIGIDVRAALGTMKGSDNRLYNKMMDLRTGKTRYVALDDAASHTVAFPGQDPNSPHLYAMRKGVPTMVPREEVDFMVPGFGNTVSAGINMTPMPTAVQAGRQFYMSKFWEQYLPQKQGEVPLVDSLMDDGVTTYSEFYGRKTGCLTAPFAGTVTKVTDNEITIRGKDGQTHTASLVKGLPFNRLSSISFTAQVKKGDEIAEGGILANSNFTDAKTGAMNMGRNLKVAVLPAPEGVSSFEDAIVISESAAKKLATSRTYNFEQETKNGVTIARNKYLAAFPKAFTKEQAETIDDNGVVKVGTVLKRDDPMILAIGPKMLSAEDAQLGKLSSVLRNALTDKSTKWEHDWPGVVTDVVYGPHGAKVLVNSEPPVKVGDKLAPEEGLKGVVGGVLEDSKMPRDAVTNEPYDMLMNPMGFLSRVAPGQIMLMNLAKVAKKTGKQIRLPQIPPPEGWQAYTERLMAENGVKDTADVFDPQTGRTIKNVGDGYAYVKAFHHLAEKKFSARGVEGAYTQDEQPAKGGEEGAKRISGFDNLALLSHGATEVIKDSMRIRGQMNDEYWRRYRLGLPVEEPGVPFIYQKFINTLRAGGINVVEKGDVTSIMPQTDADIDELAQGRVLENAQMVDSDFQPVKGGMFDLGKTGGMGGNRWSMIALPEAVPNPMMEEPVRRVLGLTAKKMEAILSGKEELNGKTGGDAIKDALSQVNIDNAIERARADMQNRRGSQRDNAIKVLGYLKAAKEMGMKPADWMITRVPVLPPMFRPVAKMGDVALVPDMNELYKELIEMKQNYEMLARELPASALADERLAVYGAVKAAYGLGNSITTEGQAKNLKGAIRQVIGQIPKFGMAQSKVFSKTQDLVGRSVTVPDKNLDMDQVGIPEEMAWTMYKPFVERKLVQRGYSPMIAKQMIDEKNATAKHLLEDAMEERPILMDRAPTWHKFNIMAFRPHIVHGRSIHVSPLIDSGFNMDHDGDESRSPYITTLLLDNLFDTLAIDNRTGVCYNPCITKQVIKDRAMKKETVVIKGRVEHGTVVSLRWDEFPHYDNPTPNNHPNANFYIVPDGVFVRAYDENTKELVWAPVKYWSHHGVNQRLEIITVNLSSGRQILTDDDPRGVYGIDPSTMEFGRWRPSESIGKFVPRCIKDDVRQGQILCSVALDDYTDGKMSGNMPVDRDSGWFLGAMIGDGWDTVDKGKSVNICFCYDRNYNNLGERFKQSVRHALYDNKEVVFGIVSHEADKEPNRYGDSITIRHASCSAGLFIHRVIGHGAEYKHLPPFWQNTSKEFRLGLLEGLLDTDGTVALTKAKVKKNRQLICNYTTISMTLATEVQYLCRTLGVDSKLTTQKTPAGGKCWQVSVSTKQLKSLGLVLHSPHKAKALADAIVKSDSSAGGRKYMIPVPIRDLKKVSSILLALDHSAYITLNRTGKKGYAPTTIADKIAKVLRSAPELQTDLWRKWLELYDNIENVVWERVDGFTCTGMYEEGFDLTVPGYETFMNSEGIILSNTVNIHVPASDKAAKQALEKMLPSKNLFSLTDLKSVRYKPEKEQISGLWALTRGKTDKPVRVFASKTEAIKAYRSGEIGPNDPIEIAESGK